MHYYYYGFAVHGIQKFIFETNELKEIVSASERIVNVVNEHFESHFSTFSENNRIDLQAAGNVRCLFQIEDSDLEAFKHAYSTFTSKTSLDFPRLEFSQAVLKTDGSEKGIPNEIEHRLLLKRKNPSYSRILSPRIALRDQRTARMIFSDEKGKTITDERANGTDRFSHMLGLNEVVFPKELSQIVRGTNDNNYFSLIHLDGNGIGSLLTEQRKSPGFNMAKFSASLKEVTIQSLREAILKTFQFEDFQSRTIPFRPIIVGGDDLTVIIRAENALDFIRHYIFEFENLSKEKLGEYTNNIAITVCAGVVFTKQKFPLHYSANLVEDMCKQAKVISQRKASSILMHRVRSSFVHEFEQLRNTEYEFESDSFFDNELFGKEDLEVFQKDMKEINKEDFPTSEVRNLLAAKLNGDPKEQLILSNLKRKSRSYLLHSEFDIRRLFRLINLQNVVR